jgi:hypothetical protein
MVYQNPGDCPVEFVCLFIPGGCTDTSKSMMSVSRGLRDDVLSRTSRGQRYTEAYYRFSSEAVQILTFNPMLVLRSREVIERYKPVIQSMVNGEGVRLTDGDLDEIEGLLDSFSAKGSADLQEAIRGVCKDIRDPQIHKEFGITVTTGPKRSITAPSLIQIIKQTGGPAAFKTTIAHY